MPDIAAGCAAALEHPGSREAALPEEITAWVEADDLMDAMAQMRWAGSF